MATTTETNAMDSKVQTSWRVPLLYSMQYLLCVSHVRAKVTVEYTREFTNSQMERKRREDT
jgi:hypothetical protein